MISTVNLDTAARLDIVCRKGDTFNLSLDFGKAMTDPDVATGTNNVFVLQVRETDTATGSPILSMGSDADEVNIVDGQKTDSKMNITKAHSSMENVTAGLYVYDLQETTINGTVKTLLYGTFKVNEDVTVV